MSTAEVFVGYVASGLGSAHLYRRLKRLGLSPVEVMARLTTIGQPVVGTATRGGFELCAGFRCDVAMLRKTFLPLILRSD